MWRRVGLALLFALAVAYAARRPLLTMIGSLLIVRDPPVAAEAIVVLSGSLPDRILEAVDLYNAHLAPRLILTREPPLPGLDALRARGGNVIEAHEQNVAVAERLGVPAAALTVLPTPVSSTWAEAQTVIAYLRQQHIESILLVTSKAHSRRARLIFRHLGPRLTISVCPSRYDPFTPESWWLNRGLVRRVVIEYGKLAYFLLVDRWRTPGGP